MDLTAVKRKVSSYDWSKKLAEPVLNLYVRARYLLKKQYTKDGEDKAVLSVFKERFGIAPAQIRYFDFGANHYLRGNNTYLCYRQGGKGVLVEADPLLCEGLRKKRVEDQVWNIAISDKLDKISEGSSLLNFYVCSLPTRSTLDAGQAEELVRMGFKIERVIEIPSMTFEDIVKKTGIIPDYLSIDIEGYDLRVLKSIDFKKFPIKVIVAECDKTEEKDMIDYMKKQGYQLYKRYRANVLFIRTAIVRDSERTLEEQDN